MTADPPGRAPSPAFWAVRCGDRWHLVLGFDPAAFAASTEARDRELIARHLRAAASAINIQDWPAYLRRVADLHETGEAWYRP